MANAHLPQEVSILYPIVGFSYRFEMSIVSVILLQKTKKCAAATAAAVAAATAAATATATATATTTTTLLLNFLLTLICL